MPLVLTRRRLLNQKSGKCTCVASRHGGCGAHLLEVMLQLCQDHFQICIAGFKQHMASACAQHSVLHPKVTKFKVQ